MTLSFLGFLLISITTITAVTVPAAAESQGVRISHPCDINADGYIHQEAERLCMEVWQQDAYTVVLDNGSMADTPAGPVVVTELMAAWEMESPGNVLSLMDSLHAYIDMYGMREL